MDRASALSPFLLGTAGSSFAGTEEVSTRWSEPAARCLRTRGTLFQPRAPVAQLRRSAHSQILNRSWCPDRLYLETSAHRRHMPRCVMTRLFLASIAVVSALALIPYGVEAQKATPKKGVGEEKIEWGKETRGQVANLRALKTVVKSGEPIESEILVKNVSNRDVGLPSGHADEKMSACFWTFYFDEWEWRSAHLSARQVPLKPGETASVRCLVATTRDSMTAEQKE